MIKDYYYLTKPGIIYGNAFAAIAGFFLGLQGNIDWRLFISMLVGLALVIASGCVFNNIYDTKIDAKMQRTQNRSLVTGKISKINAFIFGTILLALGILVFELNSYSLPLITALIGFIVYVFIYTPLKHKTVYATLIGSIAGAVPPVVGYTAATNKIDAGAIIIFVILILWQMPHFYSIAIRRQTEYSSANIPVLPIKHGIRAAKIHILIYVLAFIAAVSLLYFYNYGSIVYLTVIMLVSLIWLYKALKGFGEVDHIAWAKDIFKFSLIVLTTFCVIIPIDKLIH